MSRNFLGIRYDRIAGSIVRSKPVGHAVSRRVLGRISLFGEHLIKLGGVGASLPILKGLWYGDLPDASWYDSRKDSVRSHAESSGILIRAGVHGDLPLGYGFAGSAALAALYLLNAPSLKVDSFMRASESAAHDMPSSGFDIGAILHASPGLFSSGGWTYVPAPGRLFLVAAGFHRPHFRTDYSTVRAQLLPVAKKLIRLTHDLACSFRGGSLDEGLLYRYATILHRAGLYRGEAAALIDAALSEGLIAKGVGGLRDKAVVIFASTEESAKMAAELVDESKPSWSFREAWMCGVPAGCF